LWSRDSGDRPFSFALNVNETGKSFDNFEIDSILALRALLEQPWVYAVDAGLSRCIKETGQPVSIKL